MAIVESAAICDHERPFHITCYSLEGNSPLMLSSHDVFDELDQMVDETGTFTLPIVEPFEKSAFLINDKRSHFLSMYRKSEEHCFTLLNITNSKKKQLKEMKHEMISEMTTSSGRTRRSSVAIQEAIDSCNKIFNEEIERIRKEVNEFVSSLSESKNQWEKMKEVVETFEDELKSMHVDEMRVHCREIVSLAVSYYQRKFNDVDGHLLSIKQVVRVARLFDPLEVKPTSLQSLEFLANELI